MLHEVLYKKIKLNIKHTCLILHMAIFSMMILVTVYGYIDGLKMKKLSCIEHIYVKHTKV